MHQPRSTLFPYTTLFRSTRDVITYPHFPHPEPILRLAQAPQTLDPALAYPGGFVPQVPFKGVPHFGPAVGSQCPVGPSRLGSEDDLVPHSGHSIARFATASK